MSEHLNENMMDAFNEAIAWELMVKINPDLTQEKFDEVWPKCNGNPWNAPILYKMLELSK